ncbi:MAG: oligosaccharide flippase family protein, partial [Chloroflexi bacterium]|nr:oligosaccharide flippase family protein [Chloroflexota bacterium]
MERHGKDQAPPQTLAGRAARGAVFITTTVAINGMIGVLANIVFARVLGPNTMGVYAFALALSDLLALAVSIGIDVYLVQEPEVSPLLFRVALALGTLLGAIFVVLSAGLSALFWMRGQEQVALLLASLAVQRLVLINTASYFALLRRSLRFRTLSVIQIAAGVIEHVVAIAAAFLGAGVWALLVRDMLDAVVNLVLAVGASGERFAFQWQGERVRSILRFGWALLISQSGELAVHRVDSAFLGALAGTRELALYDEAFKLGDVSRRIALPALQQVVLPTYAQLRGTVQTQRHAFERVQQLGALALVPFALSLMVYPTPIITLLLGPQWSGAGPIVRVFASYVLVQPFLDHTVQLLLAHGNSAAVARAKLVQLAVFLPLLAILLPRFSGVGAAAAVVSGVCAGAAFALWEARHFAG